LALQFGSLTGQANDSPGSIALTVALALIGIVQVCLMLHGH
jgi:hypothetical protein